MFLDPFTSHVCLCAKSASLSPYFDAFLTDPPASQNTPVSSVTVMAPPPPADMPLTQRLMALAETLQFAWFCGHVTLLLCTVQYALAYITFKYYSGLAKFTYRTAFVAAAATYGIVVYKSVRARARQGRAQSGGIMALLGDENVQYLGTLAFCLSHPDPHRRYETELTSTSSYGSCVASCTADATCSCPIHSLLCVSRRYLHPLQLDTHHPAATPGIQTLCSFRANRTVRQAALRYKYDHCRPPGNIPLVPHSWICHPVSEGLLDPLGLVHCLLSGPPFPEQFHAECHLALLWLY